MESITFFGRLQLTPTLPLQVVAVEVVELVLQGQPERLVLQAPQELADILALTVLQALLGQREMLAQLASKELLEM